MIIDRTSLLTRLPQEWGLNSRGLKRICSDSSSWTFGIQGENSMKSRDEIVIIMLQWLRLYTLGSIGSRELKTFLETRLISSRVDQKLKNKRRSTWVFKGRIRPKIVVNWSIRGSGFQASWRRFFGRGLWLQIRDKSTWFRLQFHFTCATIFSTIFATIAPRLGRDRASILPLKLRRSLADRWGLIPLHFRSISASFPLHFRFDRGSIAPRSRLDRAAIVKFFLESPAPSDYLIVMKIRCSRSVHAALLDAVRSRSRDGNRMIFPSPRGHRLSLRSRHLR